MAHLSNCRRFGAYCAAWLLTACLVIPMPALGQAAECDPEVTPVEGLYGYQLRENLLPRCEGFYEEEVNLGPSLYLTSLYSGYVPFEPDSTDSVTLAWEPSETAQTVRLQALGIESKVPAPYRMDATVPTQTVAVEWPVDFLSARYISPSDVGLLAWEDPVDLSQTDILYLPLAVNSNAATGEAQPYIVELFTGATLQEIWVSVSQLADDGTASDFVWEEHQVGEGPYAGTEVLRFELPMISQAGKYLVEISGESLSGAGYSTESFVLYHAGGD